MKHAFNRLLTEFLNEAADDAFVLLPTVLFQRGSCSGRTLQSPVAPALFWPGSKTEPGTGLWRVRPQ
jgi:hypothetical protein